MEKTLTTRTKRSVASSRRNREKVSSKQQSQSPKVKRFTDYFSTEAQLAMRLAYEDTLEMKSQQTTSCVEDDVTSAAAKHTSLSSDQSARDTCTSGSSDVTAQKVPTSSTCASHAPSLAPSFSELYERNRSLRMSRDITDDAFDPSKQARRPLGGGVKLETAYEIVEVVNRDAPAQNWDAEAMQRLANLNSREKCLVWMQAIGTVDTQDCDMAEHPDADVTVW